MRLPRIGYVFMLAASMAALQPGAARAAAPPVAEDEQRTRLSPAQQAGLVLLQALIHNPWRVVPVPPAPNNPAPLDVKPQETEPTPDPKPKEPPVVLQETPEPASLLTALAGGSLALGAWFRNRRRRSKAA